MTTTQTVYRDAKSGEFVTSSYAEAHPDTTIVDHIPFGPATQPDRLQEITDLLVGLTEVQPVLTLVPVAGIEISGTDRTDVYERALVAVRQKVEAMG